MYTHYNNIQRDYLSVGGKYEAKYKYFGKFDFSLFRGITLVVVVCCQIFVSLFLHLTRVFRNLKVVYNRLHLKVPNVRGQTLKALPPKDRRNS